MLKKFWFDTAFAHGRWGQSVSIYRRTVRTGIATDTLLMLTPTVISLANNGEESSAAFALAGSAAMFAGMVRILTRSIIWNSARLEDMGERRARDEGKQTVLDTVMLSGKITTLRQASIVGRCIGSELARHSGDDPFSKIHDDLIAAIRGRPPEPKSFDPEFIRLCDIAVRAKLMKTKDLPEPCRPDPNIIEGEFSVVAQDGASTAQKWPPLGQQ